MPAPAHHRVAGGVIIRVVVFRNVNGQPLADIPVVLAFEGKRVIFGMTGDENLAAIPASNQVYTGGG